MGNKKRDAFTGENFQSDPMGEWCGGQRIATVGCYKQHSTNWSEMYQLVEAIWAGRNSISHASSLAKSALLLLTLCS